MERTTLQYGSSKLVTYITVIGAFICSFFTGSILATMLAVFIQILIHEAGHLVCGLFTGYKFFSFRFLSFMVYKDKDGKLRFKLYSLLGTSGQCIMLPPETEIEDTPYVIYNMGGVIFNLLSTLVFTAAFFALGDGFFRLFFFCLVIMGFTLALTNGIPFNAEYVANDGMNVLNIYKSERAKYAFRLSLKLHVEIENGLLYQDIPDTWLFTEENDISNAVSAQIPFFAAYVAFMKKDFVKARLLSEQLISYQSKAPEIHKMLATMLIMYCEAVSTSKKSVIAGYESEKVVKFMRRANMGDVMRAKYAVEKLVNGDQVKADSVKRFFERAAKRTKNKELVETERSFFDYVDQIYIRRLQNTETTDNQI